MIKKLEDLIIGNKTTERFLTDSKFRNRFRKTFAITLALPSCYALYNAVESASKGEYPKAIVAGISSLVFAYFAYYSLKKTSDN
ncbi:hypothetical protein HYX19_05025 [Candidatus Woesearchaeota archaeon]|nr:hypothetical protein [Candidatus Woesearchaeota archaeon]